MTLPNVEPQRFLRQALARVRWVIIALLLLLSFMRPLPASAGLPTWLLLLFFAAASLLLDLLAVRLLWLRRLSSRAVLDILLVIVVYFLGAEPGGPLFVLFFLAVDYAAASMTLRGTLLYVGAVAAIVALADMLLFITSPTAADVRMLGARLIMLGLVGAGMTLVTRRLALEQAAAQAVRGETIRLEELDRLRAEFISTVSHDLLTPLTAARASVGLLHSSAEQRLLADEMALAENARRNIERLGLLIDDLLAYNQLEAGVMQLDSMPLDLRAVVGDAAAAVSPLVQEKGQSLEIDLPAPLPTYGDWRRLEQVVLNLLANAHVHTPPGTKITISAGSDAQEVSLAVSDDGPGIESTELEAIFLRFHRAAHAVSGSGLGLAIARAIIELHGGRIWATSRPGHGTTISIALPRYVPKE